MPGTSVGRKGALIVGSALLIGALVSVVAVNASTGGNNDDQLTVSLHTEQIGEGIVTGTKVRLDGVKVGEVAKISSSELGRQMIELDLDRDQTAALTDELNVDYAPANLFGISAVVLKRSDAGALLQDNETIDLTGPNADRVGNFTLARLLRMVTSTSVNVLTPQLTDLLTKSADDLQQFTPFLESVVVLSRTVAETQRYLPSFLIGEYASFLYGLGAYTSGTLGLVNEVMNIDILRYQRDKFDATIAMMGKGALPAFGRIGIVSGEYTKGSTDSLTPLLEAMVATMPNPARSTAQFDELLDRVDRTFSDGPNGPQVNLELTLQGVPGLAVPLLGLLPSMPGGPR